MHKLSILICAGVAARRLADPTVPPNVVSTKESEMPRTISRIRDFLTSEDGPTATEYAVMLGLITVGLVSVIGSIGANISGTYSSVNSTLGGGS